MSMGSPHKTWKRMSVELRDHLDQSNLLLLLLCYNEDVLYI